MVASFNLGIADSFISITPVAIAAGIFLCCLLLTKLIKYAIVPSYIRGNAMNSPSQFIAGALLVCTTLLPVAPANAGCNPSPGGGKNAQVQHRCTSVPVATPAPVGAQLSPSGSGRTILVILPNRSKVLVPVRPGQDDRAAAFEFLLKLPVNTIAEANALQPRHRVTAIWSQGSNGIDIVNFQTW